MRPPHNAYVQSFSSGGCSPRWRLSRSCHGLTLLLLLASCDGKPVHLPLARRPGFGAGQQRRLSTDEARLYGDTSDLMAYHADIMAAWSLISLTACNVRSCGYSALPVWNCSLFPCSALAIQVGTPGQLLSVIVDTGSSRTAFPCTDCDHCGSHMDPPFNPRASSTFRWVGCEQSGCSSCLNGSCSYTAKYVEGSSLEGMYFRDVLQLGVAERATQQQEVRTRSLC